MGPFSQRQREFLTYRPGFPTIRASLIFPGSSVVERRTVNPLVGGSNPSRGANFQKILYTVVGSHGSTREFEPPT